MDTEQRRKKSNSGKIEGVERQRKGEVALEERAPKRDVGSC